MTETNPIVTTNGVKATVVVKTTNNNNTGANGTPVKDISPAPTQVDFVPPDKGLRAWIVLISAFLCNGVIFGIINTYSVIFLKLQDQLQSAGDTEASSKAGKLFLF